MSPTNFVYWLSGLLSVSVSDCGISSDETNKIIDALKKVRTEPMSTEVIFYNGRDCE